MLRQRLVVLALTLVVAIFVFVAAGAGWTTVVALAAVGALVAGHAVRWDLREKLLYGRDDERRDVSVPPPARGRGAGQENPVLAAPTARRSRRR